MRPLIDTHLALWAVTADEKLSARGEALVADLSNAVSVSVANLWEIAFKHSASRDRRRAMPINARQAAAYFSKAGFHILAATESHILAVEDLPSLHKDPF